MVASAAGAPRARLAIGSQPSAYATTASAVMKATIALSPGMAVAAHVRTTRLAATTPAACSRSARTASEAALTASVSTARQPRSGHGTVDHSGF